MQNLQQAHPYALQQVQVSQVLVSMLLRQQQLLLLLLVTRICARMQLAGSSGMV
jgi:hypothetical protein